MPTRRGDPVPKEILRGDGYLIKSAKSGNVEVIWSGPLGSAVDVESWKGGDGKAGAIRARIQTPDPKAMDPAKLADTSSTTRRTVITELMLLGDSCEDAVREFGGLVRRVDSS